MQHKHQHKQPYLDRARHAAADAARRLRRADPDRSTQRGDYRVVTDVGQHQMWAAQLIDWHRPRTHITSGGAGTMGFAVPAAMGVAVAHPERDDLGDLRRRRLPDDQPGDGDDRCRRASRTSRSRSSTTATWAWCASGRSCSRASATAARRSAARTSRSWPRRTAATGITVERVEDVEAAIEEAYATDGPVLIDFRVEREVNVFPMVPQGKSIGEMITEAPAA